MSSRQTRPAVLHIDWTRCDGRGVCAELLPEVIARDNWGYPIAAVGTPTSPSNLEIPVDLTEAAQDAVALCPRLALTLLSGPQR